MPPRSNKSLVWNFFTRSKTNVGYVVCNICSVQLSFNCGSTSGMTKHLTKKHPCEYLGAPGTSKVILPAHRDALPSTSTFIKVKEDGASPVPMKQPTLVATVEKKQIYPKTHQKKVHLDNLLIKMICKDVQPFSLVDDQGFREFVNALDCRYKLPSRRELTRDILPKMYDHYREVVLQELGTADHIATTTDIWTARTTEGYLTLTAHFVSQDYKMVSFVLSTVRMQKDHTAHNIAEQLQNLFVLWNIQEKVQAVVTDNAGNMVSAVTNELKLRSVRCFAHSLNLVVQEAVKRTEDINALRKRVKAIVTFFHHSVKASDKLQDTQKKHGDGCIKKLIQDVETRWNSTAFMLKRYSEQHEAVTTTLCLLGKPEMVISDEEVLLIKDALQALEPFFLVTEEMSSEKKPTLSKIIPFVKLLHRSLRSCQSSCLVNVLQEQLRKRFSNLEDSFVASAATFLDPRFKAIHFADSDALKKTEDRLKGMISNLYQKESVVTPSSPQDQAEPPLKKFKSIWDAHDERVIELKKCTPTKISGPEAEMRRYKECSIITRNEDPLDWWRVNRELMPHLSKLAKQYLGIPATSVPSERLFSKAGEVLSARRGALRPSHVDKILFLNKNV